MVNDLDNYFLSQPEPQQSCLLALHQIILSYNSEFTEGFAYKMPQYKLKGKPFCYLWVDKKTSQPYILLVKGYMLEHPLLVQDGKSKMRKFFVDPNGDIPVKVINEIFSTIISK